MESGFGLLEAVDPEIMVDLESRPDRIEWRHAVEGRVLLELAPKPRREERWLRELYPWPVLAQVECGKELRSVRQRIRYDGAVYEATLRDVEWQPRHGTFRYRVFVESEGLGWHSRPFADEYDMCGTPDGRFVTLFHRRKKEPLERVASSGTEVSRCDADGLSEREAVGRLRSHARKRLGPLAGPSLLLGRRVLLGQRLCRSGLRGRRTVLCGHEVPVQDGSSVWIVCPLGVRSGRRIRR